MSSASLNFCVVIVAIATVYFLMGRKDTTGDFAGSLKPTYDYIVVGAGSAGCVIASRLSEDPNVKVLLVEAGGDDRDNINVTTPGYARRLMHSNQDWNYFTVPQTHALQGFKNRRSFWPRGKLLGGSSNLNSMIYSRGDRLDFDNWAKLGAKGWSFKEVLPFFRKLEDMKDPELVNSEYHGTGGPIKISTPNALPFTDYLIKAGKEMGIDEVDINGASQEGMTRTPASIYNGVRYSTSRAYLYPIMGRKNLDIKINARVSKIMIEGKKAVGIEIVADNRKVKVKTTREVILSAGTIGSPQILMLSGIGPKKHLEQLGIPVVRDLPVGRNLQDHPFFDYVIATNTTVGATQEVMTSWKTWIQHRLFGTGILSSPHFVEVIAFLGSNKQMEELKWPDIEYLFIMMPPVVKDLSNFRFTDEMMKVMELRSKHKGVFSCKVLLLRPESRGSITLGTSDIFDDPLIDPKYFHKQADVDTIIRGVRFCQRFEKTSTMQAFGAKAADSPGNICTEHKFDTDSYWDCMIRYKMQTNYHPSSTCKMGKKEDPTSVVDHELKVLGVSGLRVADASIMPVITSANINAPVIMIGEKTAHMIATEWATRRK